MLNFDNPENINSHQLQALIREQALNTYYVARAYAATHKNNLKEATTQSIDEFVDSNCLCADRLNALAKFLGKTRLRRDMLRHELDKMERSIDSLT